MKHMVKLSEMATDFHVTEHCIDCICGKHLIKTTSSAGGEWVGICGVSEGKKLTDDIRQACKPKV